MVTGILMAAGQSKRMGKNKLLLPVDGDAMIVRTLKEILASDIGEVLAVYHSEDVKKAVESMPGVVLIYNETPELGQSQSVKLGVRHSHDDTEGYFFFAADQPFLSRRVIDRLIRVFQKDTGNIVVPTYENKRGMPILFPRKYREDLLRVSGDKGGREIIDRNLKRTVFVPIEEKIQGKDIDTYDEYRQLVLKRDSEKRGEEDNEGNQSTN